MRILVTGSREWDDWQLVSAALVGATLGIDWHKVTMVHGDSHRGLDYMADQLALSMGMTTEPHPADWDRHGKAAGPIRNQEMVDAGADICLAFFQPGALNRGTADCAARAKRAGIPVREYPEGGTREPSGGSPDSPPAGGAGLPGGSDDYLPPAAPGDDPAIDWPVLLKGASYEVMWVGGLELQADGTWHIWETSQIPGISEPKAPS